MRRSEQYTVPEELFSLPKRDIYRQAFRKLPFFQRIYLWIRSWFGSADIVEVVKEHELEVVQKRVSARDRTIADVTIPALAEGFHRRARSIHRHYRELKGALSRARGASAGSFMREALRQLDQQMHGTLEVSCDVPQSVLEDPAVALTDARDLVIDHVHQALDVNREAIVAVLEPVWQSLEALAALGTVDFRGLIPEGDTDNVKIPMRIVREPLTRLACVLEMCIRYQHRSAARIAVDFDGGRLGRGSAPDEAIWEAIDDLNHAASLLDLVRLASDEPRLTLAQLNPNSQWWARFSSAWLDTVHVGPPLLRHRTAVVEGLLKDQFDTGGIAASWIPPALYQRSVGAFRELAVSQRFRDTRTMAGALAREQNVMPAADRGRVLELHVELDRVFTRLEEMLGYGEEYGAIGEEIRKVSQPGSESGVAGMQKISVYSKFRPDVRVIVDQGIDVLEGIGIQFDTNRRVIRRALKARAVRFDIETDDLPLVELFDLLTGGYRHLALSLRSLITIEHELIVGAGSNVDSLQQPGQEAGGTGEVGATSGRGATTESAPGASSERGAPIPRGGDAEADVIEELPGAE